MSKASQHIATIDYLRMLAAGLVAYHHYGVSSWYSPSATAANSIVYAPHLLSTAWFGWVGVNIFFVISGVVIAAAASTQDTITFLKNRFLRIYPALALVAFFTYALFSWNAGRFVETEPLVGTLLVSFSGPWVDGIYWSIVVEVYFYIFVAIYIQLGFASKMINFALVLAVYSLGYWVYGADSGAHWLNLASLGAYGCYFAIGIAIFSARVAQDRPKAILAFALGLGSVFLALVVRTIPHAPDNLWKITPFVVWLGCVLLIAAATFDAPFLRHVRPARIAGRATYPFYLLHNAPGQVVTAALIGWSVNQNVAMLVSVMIVACLATLVTVQIEPRIVRAIKQAGGFIQRYYGRGAASQPS